MKIVKRKRRKKTRKKKSVAFKATSSSSKGKGKAKKEESSDGELSNLDSDDEALALFVGKFMKKKGYGARKRRDNFKGKDIVRRCYKCKSHRPSYCGVSSC
jgi:hypothetical protein